MSATVMRSAREGAAAPGRLLDCDDGNVCTDDSCNPSAGCEHSDNTSSCDDCLDINADGTCDEDEGTLTGEDDPNVAPTPAAGTPLGFAGGFCSLIRPLNGSN
jgi:hypothetical protein